uniref:Uncharacterized protein n=1 Tax=Pyxicephalus adspersus TaxID=30357 RepID=A0AAV2ZJW3_PYXAD|nr:TPA: hypothetical protein GDO54_016327 [Pyxicephalus adspersus]
MYPNGRTLLSTGFWDQQHFWNLTITLTPMRAKRKDRILPFTLFCQKNMVLPLFLLARNPFLVLSKIVFTGLIFFTFILSFQGNS